MLRPSRSLGSIPSPVCSPGLRLELRAEAVRACAKAVPCYHLRGDGPHWQAPCRSDSGTGLRRGRLHLMASVDFPRAPFIPGKVRIRDLTTPCAKCGAAMVVVRAWPAPEDPKVELHMFKCEVCEAVDFFRFKARPENNLDTA